MDFAFSEEQELLRSSARDYLTDRYDVDRVVALADSDAGWDPAAWSQLVEMGWLDPELGPLEHAVLLEETGRALLPAPLFSTIALASAALAHADGWDGSRPATLAFAEAGGPVHLDDADAVSTTASGSGDEVTLTGHKLFVPDATSAADAVVVARADGGGVGLYLVDLEAHPGVVVARSTTDRTRRLGELALDGTPARTLVAPGAEAAAVLAATRRRALAGAACEAVGVAQRAYEFSSEYAKVREAFGKPIGSYQAVSHQIADIFSALQLARSLAYWAAWCVANDDEAADQAVAAAASACGEAAVLACEKAIQ